MISKSDYRSHLCKENLVATDDIKLMAFICESPFTQRKEEREEMEVCDNGRYWLEEELLLS